MKKKDGVVEFRDRPAARSGNTPYARDEAEPAPLTQGDITQRDLIAYTLLRLETQQLQKRERAMRQELLSKLAAGAKIEPGPHYIEKTERVVIR
jgi:hypothetical protein